MSRLRNYADQLALRQRNLQDVISKLGSDFNRNFQLQRLGELAAMVQYEQSGFVIDRESPFLVRRARWWAVVGSGGIPDDVELVGEGISVWGEFGEIVQPDLDSYRNKGSDVIDGDEFVELISSLTEQIRAGHGELPHPTNDDTAKS